MSRRKSEALRLVPDAAGRAGLADIEDIIADYKAGRMVIMVDDEDRENEGDLVLAADAVSAEAVNFMACHGRGLICLTLSAARCRRLNLPPMVAGSRGGGTNFTVSIEAARGVTTGISAADRAATIRAAVGRDAGPDDITMPGHIFPLVAQPGGVLTRAGHTEAGVDLARLAGMTPASVICEVLNGDGTMARLPDLLKFGRRHKIKVGSIADLIRHRLRREPTVQRGAQGSLRTRHGDFRVLGYHDGADDDGETHMALVLGEVAGGAPVLVRVHVSTGLYDVLADLRGERAWPLAKSMEKIAAEGRGVVIVLRRAEDSGELLRHIGRSQLHDHGFEDGEQRAYDVRMLGIGCQILADLGVRKLRVLGAPKRTPALSGFDLEIVEFIPAPD